MMQKWNALLFCLILLLGISACGAPEEVPPPSEEPTISLQPSAPAPSENTETEPWGEQCFEKTYQAGDGAEILVVSYSLPKSNRTGAAYDAINSYYAQKLQEMKTAVQSGLLLDARDLYQARGDMFTTYYDSETYIVAYEDDTYVSFFREQYFNTNGPHPNLNLFAETFQKDSGELVTLDAFFQKTKDEYRPAILQEVLAQADQKADTLYENYRSVIEEDWNMEQFYLGENGFIFYFQPYEIAPYAAGIITIEIPYQTLKDLMPEWN